MKSRIFLLGLAALLALLTVPSSPAPAAEKVRLGAAAKVFMPYNLPVLAAEEKGFWRANGLEVEFLPFSAPPAMIQAIAARSLDMGLGAAETVIRSAAAGVPVVIVAHVVTRGADFQIWVKTDSPIREAKELKGAKVGVAGLADVTHAYGQYIAKTHGLEREVKFIAAGGVQEIVAALRAGKIDAVVLGIPAMANLVASGEVRKILTLSDYLPKEWVERIIMARRDFLEANPKTASNVVKVFRQASEFLKENQGWALEKMKSNYSLSEPAARLIYDNLITTIDVSKIDKKALENVKEFQIKFGLISKEKSPSIDAIYRGVFD